MFSVRVAEKEQGGQWSFAVGAQMANSDVGPLGAKPRPVKDFIWVFLVSPVRLFCYVIKGKQVQKSVNLAANARAKVGRH